VLVAGHLDLDRLLALALDPADEASAA
jgi:hypothetical protein